MLELQNHVTSLELSKKLRELGVPQKSCIYWTKSITNRTVLRTHLELFEGDDTSDAYKIVENNFIYSAFLSSELGKMISDRCNEWAQGWNDSGCFRHFAYGNRGSGYMIEDIGKRFIPEEPEEDVVETEANDRAKFLIHLLSLLQK